MAEFLPLFFFFVMGMALFIYVILDGYDLGIGILLPLGSEQEKDMMIAAIGPFWDANETWIVLGVGVLLIAFPEAHGIVLSTLYLPVTFMLIGLILRGAAFDLRVKAGDARRGLWNRLFFLGSLLATLCQGWMVGAYITGLSSSTINFLFSALIALTLPALYITLGSAWLMIKTEGALRDKAMRWARLAILPVGVAMLLISIATPLVSELIADKWFSWDRFLLLLPIPLVSVLAYGLMLWLLFRTTDAQRRDSFGWKLYVLLLTLCLTATLGLAYSLFPDIILGQMTLYESASSTESLQFVFVGTAITLPLIFVYTVYVYRVFAGKIGSLEYE